MTTDDSLDVAVLDALVPSRDADLRATVFVHSLAPVSSKESQDRLVDQLGALAERGVLSDVDLLVWGKSICTGSPLAGVGSGERILDSIGEFYDLAANSDLCIAPFFRISDVTSECSEASFRRIVPPCRAVAVYDDETLAAVFPCLVDGTTYTPEDLLAYLGRRRTTATEGLVVDESA